MAALYEVDVRPAVAVEVEHPGTPPDRLGQTAHLDLGGPVAVIEEVESGGACVVSECDRAHGGLLGLSVGCPGGGVVGPVGCGEIREIDGGQRGELLDRPGSVSLFDVGPEVLEVFLGPLEFLVFAECEHGPRHCLPGPPQLPVQLDQPPHPGFDFLTPVPRVARQPAEQRDQFRELLGPLSKLSGLDGASEPVERLGQLEVCGQVVGVSLETFPQAAGGHLFLVQVSGPGGPGEPGPSILVRGFGDALVPVEKPAGVARVGQQQSEHRLGLDLLGVLLEDLFEQFDGQVCLVPDLGQPCQSDGGDRVIGDGLAGQVEELVSLDLRTALAGLERQ